ncbi:MAG: hypothetical protein J7L73_03080 [Anaerolineales bacterium]|nr:hypothetical protein [Anaerolineales bacterium]
MNANKELLDSEIREQLEKLREIPPRDPQMASHNRAKFMAEAGKIQQLVSQRQKQRHTLWKFNLFKKERSVMLTTLTSIMLALVIGLGGTGATVFAAQDAMPDSSLYGVKIKMEDLQLELTHDPADQIALLNRFATRRVEEIQEMANQNKPVPESVEERLREQTAAVIQLSQGMPDEAMAQVLDRTRIMLQRLDQKMAQVQEQVNSNATPTIARVREMIQERIQLVEIGLQDPAQFRLNMRNQEGETGDHEQNPNEGNEHGQGNEPGEPYPSPNGTQEQNGAMPGMGFGLKETPSTIPPEDNSNPDPTCMMNPTDGQDKLGSGSRNMTPTKTSMPDKHDNDGHGSKP